MESSKVSLPRTPSLPAAMFLAANRNTSSPQLKLLDNTSRSLETAAANLSSAKQGESPGEGVRMAVQRIAFAFYSYTSGSVWIASESTWKNFYFQARITRINGRVAKNYQRKMKRKTNYAKDQYFPPISMFQIFIPVTLQRSIRSQIS